MLKDLSGMGVYKACLKAFNMDNSSCTVGLQPAGTLPQLNIPLFVIPSSSARVTHYQKKDKVLLLQQMKQLLHTIKTEAPNNSPQGEVL